MYYDKVVSLQLIFHLVCAIKTPWCLSTDLIFISLKGHVYIRHMLHTIVDIGQDIANRNIYL